MMTPIDAVTRHAIELERLKANAIKEAVELINSLGDDLFIEIAKSDLESLTRKEAQALVAKLRRIIKGGYGPVDAYIESTLKEFGVYEGAWQSDMLVKTGLVNTLGVASDADIWAAMYARPFQGRLLKEWVAGLEAGTLRRITEAVRQGYVDGKSALEIARDIRGTRNRKGIIDMSKRGADAMIRTAFSHTQTVAREKSYDANPTIKYEQHLSILDSRTTPICQSLDGEIFKRGSKREKRYRLPLHIGERSTRIPVTSRNKGRLEGRETYQDFLKRQSAAYQDNVLGKKKGKLFRDGGLTVDKFVNRAGDTLTLEQLKQRDAAAWEEAFGDYGAGMAGRVLLRGMSNGKENLEGLDRATGKLYAQKDGTENFVGIPDDLLNVIKQEDAQVEIHHNHPSSRSFSPQDFTMVGSYPGLKTLYAHGHDGSVYRANRVKGFSNYDLQVANNATAKPFIELEGEFHSNDDRNALFHHVYSSWMDAQGFISYSAELKGGALEAYIRNKGIIDGIIQGFSK